MTPNQPPAVELYVRSLSSRTCRTERVIEQLRQLDADGELSDLAVTVWGDGVDLSSTAIETPRGQAILDTVEEFRTWAEGRDHSVEPFFQRQKAQSTMTGKTHATLQLPSMMLAEYAGDQLIRVTPHEENGTVWTVSDRVERLATDIEETPESRTVKPEGPGPA